MIIVVIIGVLAAIAVPSLAPWFRQQQVNAALNQIDLALQETQAEAVKRQKVCHLEIFRGATPTLTGNCLKSGSHTLAGVTLNHSRRDATWVIAFNAAGENRSPANDPGTVWLDAPGAQSKCLVLSVGIGLRRMGQYRDNDCITP